MRTSNLALYAAESPRPLRRSAPADRSRLVAIAEIVALVAIVISLIVGTIVTSAGTDTPTETTRRVFVEQGDTPWTIATRHPVAGQTTERTARQIAELNGAASDGIAAGTTIEVPAAAPTQSTVAYR